MNYLSDDKKIQVELEHTELPQTDETRTYYNIKLTLIDDLKINDFKNNFSVFSFDGRISNFKKLGYLNESNIPTIKDIDLSAPFSEIIKLGNKGAYFDYFSATTDEDIVNLGIVIKSFKATIGGSEYNGSLAMKTYMTVQ